MRGRNTLEFLGLWAQLHNPDFNPIEFDGIKKQAGLNVFSLSPSEWIRAVGAIGMATKAGRYDSGTFAHPDIALEFGSWLSPAFKLMVVKELQRLKAIEAEEKAGQLDWNLRRALTKVNYRFHAEAVRQHLVPLRLSGTKA